MIYPLKTLVFATLTAITPICATADNGGAAVDEVLVIVSSASQQTQGMAMVLSSTMLEKGAKVNVLLCDQAGDLALKTYDAPALKPREVTPGQLLRGLLAQGASVNVCALYLPNSKYGREELFEGVGIAMPPQVVDQMLDSGVRTFEF
ncbi:hypothetical protein DYI22_05800 [Marinobacter lipolyticus]|uniref:hypothetical protein n=1 Tax=Marinobacter lipolyticus TaxID=209639 RepID=UPI001BCCFAC4|nr:hypothetical protein [Marinobacter lipolyticus]MBS8240015.1 hypothetical protein [Marinobacter lipolyticus]